MIITPLNERLLVKVDVFCEEKVLSSGIIVPALKENPFYEGVVLAVGKGKTLKNGTVLPMDVSVGDRIVFHKYNGTKLVVDNEEYQIIDQKDIYAVKEEE